MAQSDPVVPVPAALREKQASPEFRADLEGLRAVASLTVASFHIWLDKVSGGVDVFFVVSGFFVTATLFRQYRRLGRVSPSQYLGRLAERLAPGALTVVAATAIATWAFLQGRDQAYDFRAALGALFEVQNIDLALGHGGPVRTPFDHFWAMSAQAQFYLVWLVLGLIAVALVRRRGADFVRSFLVGAVVVVVLSAAWSVVGTALAPASAFYSSLTRIWEFGAGGLAAILLPRLRIPRPAGVVLVWAGTIGFLALAFLVPGSIDFPGAIAFGPVACALAVVVSGQKGPRLRDNAFLNWGPLVRLGAFSFGLYLWHFPVLVVAQWHGLTPEEGVLVLAGSILLAWLTHRYVEQPAWRALRGADPVRRRRAHRLLAASWALLVLVIGIATAVEFVVVR